jgi:hypothetical protein
VYLCRHWTGVVCQDKKCCDHDNKTLSAIKFLNDVSDRRPVTAQLVVVKSIWAVD